MSQEPGETQRSPIHRARFASLWGILAVESVAIAALVVGLWWFIGSHEEGWPLASVLLDPVLWLVVIGASVLGAMGNLALYYLGKNGSGAVFARFPSLEGERWEQIGGYYQRHGGKLLLFSAVPGLGTVLTTGAGAYGIRRISFLFWVILAKMMRNWVLLLFFHQSFQVLRG
jgi:membrane protein YqaA with SNARE-associated domain